MIIQYVLWGISFITLWLVIVWLNFLYMEQPAKKKVRRPSISIGIPVYSLNRERDPMTTIRSIYQSGYPKKKIEVIVVDDGSKDDVVKRLKAFRKANPHMPFKLVQQPNGGKASAVNAALDRATGELFAVVDSDSRITKGSIDANLPHFENAKVGAVISRVRVDEPKTFLERLQRFEYIMSSMTRKVMSNFGTLAITPGVLSMYRTSVLRKVGGFTKDKENITEDLEIALRLKFNGYEIVMEHESVTYTKAPDTIGALWRQRIRWARGYIYNHWNYRKMFFSSKYGLFGTFQLPINVLAVLLLILNVGLIMIDVSDRAVEFAMRSLTIPGYFWSTMFDFPSLKEFILARNVQVMLPLMLAFVCFVYLVVFAHRLFKENLRTNVPSMVAYTIAMPYFSTVNWISSIGKELAKTKRKW